ncbi:Iron-sulfur cluster carrier protein [subsurface metagenome]
MLDLPPSTSDETFSFFNCLPDLLGVILISQPSEISVVGLRKTIDFLKREEKPILGLVENMALCLCPQCGAEFYPFVSGGVDLKKLARQEGIPFLVSIPQVDTMDKLKPYFDGLAEKVIRAEGKVLKQDVLSIGAKLERAVIKKGLGL